MERDERGVRSLGNVVVGAETQRLARAPACELGRYPREHRHVGSAKTVDRLLAIADDQEARGYEVACAGECSRRAALRAIGRLAQQVDEIALHAARVLELVDEKHVEHPARHRRDVPIIAQRVACRAQQIAEAESRRAAPFGRAAFGDLGQKRTHGESARRELRRRGHESGEAPRAGSIRLAPHRLAEGQEFGFGCERACGAATLEERRERGGERAFQRAGRKFIRASLEPTVHRFARGERRLAHGPAGLGDESIAHVGQPFHRSRGGLREIRAREAIDAHPLFVGAIEQLRDPPPRHREPSRSVEQVERRSVAARERVGERRFGRGIDRDPGRVFVEHAVRRCESEIERGGADDSPGKTVQRVDEGVRKIVERARRPLAHDRRGDVRRSGPLCAALEDGQVGLHVRFEGAARDGVEQALDALLDLGGCRARERRGGDSRG